MKKFVWWVALTLVLFSCGSDGGRFRIKGQLKNFNQGEFYIYSPDGGMLGLDTLKVVGGKFDFSVRLDNKATFVIVFPNYSEHVVFGESGITATIKGDASNLREVEITGSETNKSMTSFRLRVNNMTPPEAKKEAEKYIKENPTSIVSAYILRKYFIDSAQPDYEKAYELASLMAEADKDNVRIALISLNLFSLSSAQIGQNISMFSAVDLNGDSVGRDYLNKDANVIFTFSTWNADSQTMFRELKKMKKDNKDKIAIISFCLDASTRSCRNFLKRDSADWKVVCDGEMWLSPTVRQLGLETVPASIIADKDGKIVARNLRGDKLRAKINELIN